MSSRSKPRRVTDPKKIKHALTLSDIEAASERAQRGVTLMNNYDLVKALFQRGLIREREFKRLVKLCGWDNENADELFSPVEVYVDALNGWYISEAERTLWVAQRRK